MFEWFNQPPTISFKYCPRTVADEFKKDYREDYKSLENTGDTELFLFEPTKELDAYCALLRQNLEQIKEDDLLIVQRKAYLRTRIDEQIHSCLSKELEAGAIAVDDSLVDHAIWGGEQFETVWELRYLDPERVREVAHVLREVDTEQLMNHFDTSTYDLDDRLEDFRKSSQELKTCFVEAAERGQVILTTII
ncbi:MAG: DUF1877 family protein [Phormidesmis sp. RL_2_1]|nr:DUF1877 family protein [Phormidesmis sp. RL_2_1]